MARFDLTLSPNYVANWGFKEAIREIFQNALDQQSLDPANTMSFSFSREKDLTFTLIVCSALSTLDKSSLLLGHTDKAGDAKTIGQFGEGYKLALIVLLRLGLKVQIHNFAASETWVPSFQHSAKFGTKILSINVSKFRLRKAPDANLTYVISGISPQDMREWRKFNLLTNVNYESMDLLGRQVLTEPRHKGHIYVSGLFVCKSTTELKYGYNLWPEDVKLDRDRGMVDNFNLIWALSFLWAAHPDKPFVINMIKDGTKDIEYIQHSYHGLQAVLKADFIEEYGEDVVPVQSQSQINVLRESGYTGSTIIVNPTVYQMIGLDFHNAIKRQQQPTPYEILQEFHSSYANCMDEQSLMRDRFEYILEQSKAWRN